MGNRNNEQRLKIKDMYKLMFGKVQVIIIYKMTL
jgi:hypothetical protein